MAMHVTREIVPGIHWVGGSDRRLERFENLFPLPNGVTYNSWLISDEKTALIDTVDGSIGPQFLENIAHALQGRALDYLVINHMEPDHCAHIDAILRLHPQARLVGNAKTHAFFHQFYPGTGDVRMLEVKEGDRIPLGRRTLRFILAPMVHWPEVMFTCEEAEGILFSADAFGAFGALPGNLFADELDFGNLFLDETRRYYANIVGRYGPQVQAVLKKLAGADIRMICPLHGPMWRKDLPALLDLYDRWSRYEPEKKGVMLAYGSMYGNTENAVNALAARLADLGTTDMRIHDISKVHPSYVIADIWKYSHLVLAAPTYNMGLYYPMHNLLHEIASLGLRNRTVALIGNHTWSSAALKEMQGMLSGMKDMTVIGQPQDLRSTVRPDDAAWLDALAREVAESVRHQV